MPQYYFDLENDNAFTRDSIGAILANREGAGKAAIAKLRLVGNDSPPDRDRRKTFAVHVRDSCDEPVLKACVSYSFQWLDGKQSTETTREEIAVH